MEIRNLAGSCRRSLTASFATPLAAGLSLLFSATWLAAQPLTVEQVLARDIHRELVEINTVTATGDTLAAAQAMASRLTAAGFPAADVLVLSPGPRKGNLVARLRGSGARRPMLLLAHLDVVEAKPADWSVPPFKLTEADGYFYGRGVWDDKYMAAAFVANLIRYRREGFRPDRDLIVALETDEEIIDANAQGIQWLLKNHRDLIDAAFALNEGGSAEIRGGRVVSNAVQTSEKVSFSYRLEVTNKGGHSAWPVKDNAIYHLAEGLTRLGRFDFPVQLNETTRAYFERSAEIEGGARGADMRAVVGADPAMATAAAQRLSALPTLNSLLRTTCVATLLEGGHAVNALPQTARASVNCRILPGVPFDEVQRTLVRVLDDPQITVTPIGTPVPSPASPLDPDLMRTITRVSAEFWPAATVLPTMLAAATDGSHLRNAGIPTYGHSGLAADLSDLRIHGKDERILVKSFDDGVAYLYRLVKALSSLAP